MFRTRLFGVTLAFCLVLAFFVIPGTAAFAQNATTAPTVSIVYGDCTTVTIDISNPGGGSYYTYGAAGIPTASGGLYSVQPIADNFGTFSAVHTQVTFSWTAVSPGSGIGISMAFWTPGFASFLGTQSLVFTCAEGGLPGKRVMAVFPAGAQLYSTPSLSLPIAGATFSAGQTWYVTGISVDKKFYTVYITQGIFAWVPVGSAVLQGSAPWVLTDGDDNNGPAVNKGISNGGTVGLVCITVPGKNISFGGQTLHLPAVQVCH